MTTKHTPIIRLQAARYAYSLAQEACAHWDMESEGGNHECCYRMDDAKRELRLAKRAVEKVA
jgi:hypothetical protein